MTVDGSVVWDGKGGVRRGSWHVLRDGARLVLTRHVPARVDVVVETVLPLAGRERVAHQVRQDMWRAVQRQRGFSPVVEVVAEASELRVRAGGRIEATRFDRVGLEARIAEVLEAPQNRRRWIRLAGGQSE